MQKIIQLDKIAVKESDVLDFEFVWMKFTKFANLLLLSQSQTT